ncbi:Pex12 amino terminal region-domain-containing protein [Achaetomium macrosporum]|uniref:RING-type E3 ubiquitin transferase n=1 Tax=Achaetomium macrosporum TaxID=79813 RepID=A0AAN7C421_9PEZI|nr:Pex12 amino terminal region-domain-containing protein [Achaetomium macrosporum]
MASSQPPPSHRPPPLTSSPYPFAAAPDIIRAHQKDAYFQGVLTNQLSDLHRRLRGARSAHAWATETRTFADALYLCLTTLLGNRTLGEEYCDLVQVEAPPHNSTDKQQPTPSSNPPVNTPSASGPVLPSLPRRLGSILSSTLLPYLASLLLPRLRSTLRKRLQSRLAALTAQGRDEKRDKSGRPSTEYRIVRYLLTHLTTLTSGAHFHAVTLAVFYFTGAYYSLSKRVFGLRYVFTKRVEEENGGQGGGRGGYEVLGVLLVVQMVVRAYLHVREQLAAGSHVVVPGDEEEEGELLFREREGFRPGAAVMVDVSLNENAYTSNNELLGLQGAGVAGSSSQRGLVEIAAATHTPVPKGGRPRYDLGSGEKVMGWIKGAQQRKCTLCLEELKDPAATQCGHVFCWACIGDWVREKPECPLCRRETMVQHILPLRVAWKPQGVCCTHS